MAELKTKLAGKTSDFQRGLVSMMVGAGKEKNQLGPVIDKA